ncbi:MAG: hypothetical protein Q9191_007548 [Dirinaria sp. TL-2023a]
MFPDTESGVRRGSDASLSSCSTTSSTSSSSLSPPFANPISVPLKSLISPPSTTTATDCFSLSPATPPPVPYNSPSSNSACAFPSWPSGPLLSSAFTTSPTSCYFQSANGWKSTSSHISDDDLLDLEELELRGDMRVVTGLPEMEISWSMTRQPPVIVREPERKPVKKSRRRRSSPLKKERWVGKMSPIVEGQE